MKPNFQGGNKKTRNGRRIKPKEENVALTASGKMRIQFATTEKIFGRGAAKKKGEEIRV